jgi:spore germination protein D
MKRKWIQVVPTVILTILVSSCGSDSSPKAQGTDYNQTKTIVMDILKSDDGKKAVQNASQGAGGGGGAQTQGQGQSQIKLLSAGDSLQLQMVVKDVLTSPENNKFLQDMMKDPKFAGDFAKAIQAQTKQMNKDLLKDPQYQALMIDVMKNPDHEKMILDIMKTAPYRQQMMTVIQESMQSPLFRADLVELLKTAIAQQSQPGAKTSSTGGAGKDGKSGATKGGDGGGSK